MIQKLLTCFLVLASLSVTFAQTSARIVDSQSGESIPYATITYGNEHLISNDDGAFTVPESADNATLTISFMGYSPKQVKVSDIKGKNAVIKMDVAVYELQDVAVTKPDADAIMKQVRTNLSKNYVSNPKPLKRQIFMRTMNTFRPRKMEVEVTKSTGFDKRALELTNKEIASFTTLMMKRPPKSYTDRLFRYYTAKKTVNNAPTTVAKMDMIKAVRLADESNSTDLEQIQENVSKMLLKHIDTTKYYRMKSGWFGSKDTIRLRKDQQKKGKKKEVNSRLNAAKNSVSSLLAQNSPMGNGKLDFIGHPDRYEYKYDGAVMGDDNDWLYVISFTSDSRKAKFHGKLYVSQTDFAIVRMDYALDEGEKLEGLNLKILLGIKFAENVAKGTVIFKKDAFGDGYYLHYASEETGQYFYIHRPLKFIELTDESKDVVAFDFKVEGNSLEKTEYLALSREEVSESEYDAVKEEEFKYQVYKKYDPNVWKNVGAIEPLQEMKQYQATE